MNKTWIIILMAIFITVLIWSGLEVYSCVGGLSEGVFGVNLPVCQYQEKEIEDLLSTEITPIPDTLDFSNIQNIQSKESLVIVKTKEDL
ncbi:hypothetical protein KC660_00970 [Candidatus Dojkabacteria bacterium]|uniref:Uncharacterized protein n=1 Tax=Candidatus Dojkabacteria bacterium TaxID=2099670 RepID=A0A955L3C0_9BACT|nr:hypothetical protein [Candidatus Dojkabacteria bacterium]